MASPVDHMVWVGLKRYFAVQAVSWRGVLKRLLPMLALLTLSATAMAQGSSMPWPLTDQQWQQVTALRGIATQPGMNVPALYVFFDPDCPWCATLWETRLNGKSFKDVPAVWVPVTYLTSNSLGKAAALLRSGAKVALEQNFHHYDTEHRSGGIIPVKASDSERKALGQAKALWLQLGGATPMFVYRTATGKTLIYLGLPKDPAQLTAIVQSLAVSRLSNYPD